MSKWIDIKDSDDVSLSEDKTEIHIWYGYDDDGNCYVSVPVELIKKLLESNASRP